MLQLHVASHMSTLSIKDKRQNAYPVYVNTRDTRLGLTTFWKSPYLNGIRPKKKKRELPIVVPPRLCSRQSVRSNRSVLRKGILKNSQQDSGSEDSRLTKKLRRTRSFSIKDGDVTKRVQFGEEFKLSADTQSEIVKTVNIPNIIPGKCNIDTFRDIRNSTDELEPRPATAMGIERTSSLISIERTPYTPATDGSANNQTNNASPVISVSNRPPPPRARILRRANTAAAIIMSNPSLPPSKTCDPSSSKPSERYAIPPEPSERCAIPSKPSERYAIPSKPTASNPSIPRDFIPTIKPYDSQQSKISSNIKPGDSPTTKQPDGSLPGASNSPTLCDFLSTKPPSFSMPSKLNKCNPSIPDDTIPTTSKDLLATASSDHRSTKPSDFPTPKQIEIPKRPKTCIGGRRAILANHINFCDKDKTIRILKWLKDVDDVQLKEGKYRELIEDLHEH